MTLRDLPTLNASLNALSALLLIAGWWCIKNGRLTAHRNCMLAALGCVSYVTIFDDATPLELLNLVRPDVLTKGGQYKPEEIVGYELVTSYGGQVCVTGMVDGISTSQIVKSLGKQPTPEPHFYLVGSRIANSESGKR